MTPQSRSAAGSSAAETKPDTTATAFPYEIAQEQYSTAHAPHIGLLDEYFTKVRAQEKLYVDAGLPADGLTDFLTGWFHAWEQRSAELLRNCMADNLVCADPTINGSRDWLPGQPEVDLYQFMFTFLPDAVFYPQDDTIRALPYFDFLDGNVRLTVPWRVVGTLRLTRRTIDVIGVDRYNMVRDADRGWLIARIDTDTDLLGLFGQALPIPLRSPSQKTLRRALKVVHRLFPALRGPQVRPFVH